MSKKILTRIFGLCSGIGFFMILGIAGSVEQNRIGFNTALIMGGIGVIVMLIGVYGLRFIDSSYFN
jgi:hypothetical protein